MSISLNEFGRYIFDSLDEEGRIYFDSLGENGGLILWNLSGGIIIQILLDDGLGGRDVWNIHELRNIFMILKNNDELRMDNIKYMYEFYDMNDYMINGLIKMGIEILNIHDYRDHTVFDMIFERWGIRDFHINALDKGFIDNLLGYDVYGYIKKSLKILYDNLYFIENKWMELDKIVADDMRIDNKGIKELLSMISDKMGIIESLFYFKIFYRILGEIINYRDDIGKWMGFNRFLNEMIFGFDSRKIDVNMNRNEIIGGIDDGRIIINYIRGFMEYINGMDDFMMFYRFIRVFEELFGGIDHREIGILFDFREYMDNMDVRWHHMISSLRENGGIMDSLNRGCILFRDEGLRSYDSILKILWRRMMEVFFINDLMDIEEIISALMMILAEELGLFDNRRSSIGKYHGDDIGIDDGIVKNGLKMRWENIDVIELVLKYLLRYNIEVLMGDEGIIHDVDRVFIEWNNIRDVRSDLISKMIFDRTDVLDRVSKNFGFSLMEVWRINDDIIEELKRIEGISLEYYLRERILELGLDAYGISRRIMRLWRNTAFIYPCDVSMNYQLGMDMYLTAECRIDIYVLEDEIGIGRVNKSMEIAEMIVKSFMENRGLGDWQVITVDHIDYGLTYRYPGLGVASLRIKAFKRLMYG